MILIPTNCWLDDKVQPLVFPRLYGVLKNVLWLPVESGLDCILYNFV